jgi:hypothetical protein
MIEPFKEQLESFELEKKALLSRSEQAQGEVKKLATQYGALLGNDAVLLVSVVDPNPKESEYFGWIGIRKKFEFGFGCKHCCKIKKHCVKNRRTNTKLFSSKTFFYVVQIPEHI